MGKIHPSFSSMGRRGTHGYSEPPRDPPPQEPSMKEIPPAPSPTTQYRQRYRMAAGIHFHPHGKVQK